MTKVGGKGRAVKAAERPREAAETPMPKKILRDLEEYAREKGLSKTQEKELLDRALNIYKNSVYDPEEAVGVVAAQSMSEPTTQMTMRTYHFAGTAGIQVTLGLPRLLEIFDARKEPKTPTMTIYLKGDYQSPEKARKVAENIKEVKLRDVVLSDVLDLTKLEIRCRLDGLKLGRLEIQKNALPKKVKLRNISAEGEGDDLVVSSKNMDLKNLIKLKYRLLETHIKGIKGISQAVVNKEENEWIINTLGSNLMRVFEIEGVDSTRTVSNNIFETLDVLGVEAARNAIIRQSMYTIEEQGLGVDIRYAMLLADLMTVNGDIRAIGRYGIAGQKASVLARAAFEETKNHLVKAAIREEKDEFRGIVENIMVNQVVPIGTGAFQLKGWIPEKGKKD